MSGSRTEPETPPEVYDVEPPVSLVCPITQEIMSRPVMNSAGFIYEEAAIKRWYESHDTDPQNRARVDRRILVFAIEKNAEILDWKKKHVVPASVPAESKVPHASAPSPVVEEKKPAPPQSMPGISSRNAGLHTQLNFRRTARSSTSSSSSYSPLLIAGLGAPSSALRQLPRALESKDIKEIVVDQSEDEVKTVQDDLNLAFLRAVEQKDEYEAKIYLENGAQLAAKMPAGMNSGKNAFMIATLNKDYAMLSFLCSNLSIRTDIINDKDDTESTALGYAIVQKDETLVLTLIKHGAFSYTRLYAGRPLHELGIHAFGREKWESLIAHYPRYRQSIPFASTASSTSLPAPRPRLDASEIAFRNSLRR